jgi:hypothetical protein
MVYKTGVKTQTGSIGPAYWFIFDKSKLLVNTDSMDNRSRIPYIEDIAEMHPLLSDIS